MVGRLRQTGIGTYLEIKICALTVRVGIDPATRPEPWKEESADSLPPPQNRLTSEDGRYQVGLGRSVIERAGRNTGTKHDETIGVAQGEITVEDHLRVSPLFRTP